MPEKTFSKCQRKAALISGGVFHLYHDGIADGMAVFLPLWHMDFGLSLASVGLLVTCFEGAAGIFQIPAGFLGERFGERKLLVTGTLMTAIAFACMWMAGGLISLITLLIIGGVGAAVQHPLASSMISRVYNDKGRRLALGTYNFSGDIGKFSFPALAAVALNRMGWRPICTILGIFGCFLTAVLFPFLKRAHSGDKIAHTKEQQKFPFFGKWGIENSSAFAVLSSIGIIDTAVRIGVVSFLPFLFIQKGICPESAGFALSLLLIGGAAGKFICGC
ncbi:MAG: MFS transporter [Spirochaetes bacterium]|nr:MFS transporter [Spirochaetota bacterium]